MQNYFVITLMVSCWHLNSVVICRNVIICAFRLPKTMEFEIVVIFISSMVENSPNGVSGSLSGEISKWRPNGSRAIHGHQAFWWCYSLTDVSYGDRAVLQLGLFLRALRPVRTGLRPARFARALPEYIFKKKN